MNVIDHLLFLCIIYNVYVFCICVEDYITVYTVEMCIRDRSNARDVGKTFEVMVEGVSKRSREQLFGRTQQNKVAREPSAPKALPPAAWFSASAVLSATADDKHESKSD